MDYKNKIKNLIQKIPFKKISKILSIIVFVFGVLLIVSPFIFKNYNDYLYKKMAEKLDYEIKKPYLEDYYGGKTPEETMRLFLDALKNEDVELASKYFHLDEQKKYRNYLINLGKDGGFNDLIKNWEEQLKSGEIYRDEKSFSMSREVMITEPRTMINFEINKQIEIPAGIYTEDTSLEKTQNGTWKITNL